MITFFLALIIQGNLDKQAPEILAPFPSERACLTAAAEVQRAVDKTPEARAAGVEAVCLKIVRGQEV